MKSLIKRLLRPVLNKTIAFRQWLHLLQIYKNDYRRYSRYYVNATSRRAGKDELAAWILQDKHRIEKALSLPSVRLYFGEGVLIRLSQNLKKYSRFKKDNIYFWGVGVIIAYRNFHIARGVKLPEWFEKLWNSFSREDFNNLITKDVGVTLSVKPCITAPEFKEFFTSRSSTRCFQKDVIVDEDIFRSIVDVCLKTPSVCNRQHWKVYIVGGELKSRVLSLQNGNAGFGNDVPHVAIITSSLKAFYLPAERVQGYTDGGMFAMSFLLACHAHGVSSCALNWAASLKQDQEIRKLNVIDDDEVIIMLVALGYEQSNAVVAKSPRKSVAEILCFKS